MATPATLASGFPKDLLAALRGLANGTYEALFIFYVFLLVNLPAGTLFGINFKTICFVVLLPAVLFRFFNDRHTTYVHVALLLVIPTALLTWAFVPLLGTSDEGFSFTEYKDIITTSSSCWLVAVYCGHSWERCVSFLRIVLTAELLAASTKVLMLVYCVETGTPVSTLITLINDVFKVNLMGLDFGAMLGRIQLIADGLIPICIFMLVRYRTTIRLSVGKSLLAFVLLTISLVFTYSRYFWAFGVLAFVLGLIAGKKDRFHAWTLAVLGTLTVVSFPFLFELYTARFSAAVAGASDVVRDSQIPSLIRYFMSAPFFGHGLGSHPPDVIRSIELPYAYEVQLYALAGQLGLVGMGLLCFLAACFFYPVIPTTRRSSGKKLSPVILLGVWLSAGLFNPVLLNSAAAMSYAAIRVLGKVSEEQREPKLS